MKIKAAGTNKDTVYDSRDNKHKQLQSSFKISHIESLNDHFDTNNKKQFTKHEIQLNELKKQMIDSLSNVRQNNGHKSRDLNTNWKIKQAQESMSRQPTTPVPNMSRTDKLVNDQFVETQMRSKFSRQQSNEASLMFQQ